MTNEKRLVEALQRLEPFLATEEDAKNSAELNEGRASAWATASVIARQALAEALSTPSPTSEGETPLCDEEFERVKGRTEWLQKLRESLK